MAEMTTTNRNLKRNCPFFTHTKIGSDICGMREKETVVKMNHLANCSAVVAERPYHNVCSICLLQCF